ncbi:unnamed protein product [Linum trigynum]|uniref:Uncharacterized protein n=1 Tax=Linum trigynum TaxID=586398 RepID=A0AAV2EG01_9ROSI
MHKHIQRAYGILLSRSRWVSTTNPQAHLLPQNSQLIDELCTGQNLRRPINKRNLPLLQLESKHRSHSVLLCVRSFVIGGAINGISHSPNTLMMVMVVELKMVEISVTTTFDLHAIQRFPPFSSNLPIFTVSNSH